MNQREQNNTATSSSTRKTPSIAYIGWQSEYQRQYIWRQKLHPQKVSSNSNDYNRNYATAQNIIKPRAPILQGPVNHLIRDAVDSVVERPQTPTVEYEGYQRRYDQDFDNQLGYDETDDVDGGGDGDYYDDGETRNTPHVRFNANPASTTVSPTKSNFSESNNTEKSFSSHGAVFGSEPDTPKKVSYDRSVTVNPTSSTKKQAEPPHRQQSTNNNRPPMLNYGSGNTHPTSDEHFMKSFNSKVPPSQMYPHIEDRSTRIREYETSIKSQTEQKQHHYKPGSTTTTKPTTTAATTNKTPFKAMWDAQSDAYKASSSFHTEYQREYHSFGVEMGKRINGAGKPMNHIVSMKPTALSPQPPLGSNLNGPPPPSASYKNGHEDDEDEDEDSPDASSKPIAPITTHRNSSSPNKNTRLYSGWQQ
ncbi:hypothetical protein BDR26DRAFT_310314 [Obelidium mucronatum]|nr:hypothetical protein BDR26DRAFT_310314 [Obelidium mucronatum]